MLVVVASSLHQHDVFLFSWKLLIFEMTISRLHFSMSFQKHKFIHIARSFSSFYYSVIRLGSVTAGLATAACIMGILCLPVLLVLVYRQRQRPHSSRREFTHVNDVMYCRVTSQNSSCLAECSRSHMK